MRHHSVLVVDDDRDLRESIATILEDAGYAVATAINGRHALGALRNRATPPTLILLDLTMPVMDGAAFLDERRRDPVLAAVPVVLLTAAPEVNEHVTHSPPTAYLPKPVPPTELLATVARFVLVAP